MLTGGIGALAVLLASRLGGAPPARAGGTADFGLHRGIVTDNKDDSGSYRVTVMVPELFGTDSVVAPITSPYAGDGVGFYCLPEVGDQVLVGFENGDLTRPLVLGGLWGTGEKPPTGDRHHRVVSAPGGSLTFSDAKRDPGITVMSDEVVRFRGVTSFSRSGRLVVRAGQRSGKRTGIDLTARSMVLALLQDDRPGVFVRAVVPDVAARSFVVELNKAVGQDTDVAWFVLS